MKTLKPFRSRIILLCGIMLLIFIAIFVRLYIMCVTDADTYQARLGSKSEKSITLYGKRGTIYDTNMVPLAYDETSYNVTFYRDPTKSSEEDRAAYTQVLIETIQLIESNGKSTVNDFWMKKNDDGTWRFDTGSGVDSVEASREKQWRANFYMSSVDEADLFKTLCEKYCIPADLDDDMISKVLALWQESRMNAFNSTPVTIAYNVGFETVSEIEARSMELDGINIEESSTRVYPEGSAASHIIGYTSKISQEQLETYRSKGYPTDAYVGAAGIEYSLEDQLSPYISYRQGSRDVERNTRGKVVRELDYTAPTDGNSVVLTIDIELEKVMTDALVSTINQIRDAQETQIARSSWQDRNADVLAQYAEAGREISLAESGAIVAMDPYTGRVLGMVSYPDYDLSMFNGGQVDTAKWNKLLDSNDPLYNRAISTKDAPGSIFKLCTALAGLSEGAITPDTRISDRGAYTQTNSVNPAKCWTSHPENHQNQTIVEGIKNSCNYFFYEVSNRLGITKLYKWAAALGLTSKTNIELPGEATSFVGNQNMLYDPARDINDQYTSKPMLAAKAIRDLIAKIEVERNTEFSDELIDQVVYSLLNIAISYDSKDEWNKPIREVLQFDLGLPVNYIQSHYLGNTIVTYLQDIFWTANETIMAGIGQSITQLTPIAVARYVSAIVNGGTVYDAQIVDKIIGADGSIVLQKEPVVANQIETEQIYYDLIHQGMEDVTSMEDGGTAADYFVDAKYDIAAKTGTSQRTELDVENNAWLVSYAPADDPKVVVVVYIQNGYAGARSSPAAIKVIEYYLDKLAQSETCAMEGEFSINY